jgi:hypothetical protein
MVLHNNNASEPLVGTNATKRPLGDGSSKPSVTEEIKQSLEILERCLFVRASELIARTVLATKGLDGKIVWLTLEKEFYHQLVTTAFAVCKRNQLIVTNQEMKSALFDFLLGVINGRPQSDFFDAKKTDSSI